MLLDQGPMVGIGKGSVSILIFVVYLVCLPEPIDKKVRSPGTGA